MHLLISKTKIGIIPSNGVVVEISLPMSMAEVELIGAFKLLHRDTNTAVLSLGEANPSHRHAISKIIRPSHNVPAEHRIDGAYTASSPEQKLRVRRSI